MERCSIKASQKPWTEKRDPFGCNTILKKPFTGLFTIQQQGFREKVIVFHCYQVFLLLSVFKIKRIMLEYSMCEFMYSTVSASGCVWFPCYLCEVFISQWLCIKSRKCKQQHLSACCLPAKRRKLSTWVFLVSNELVARCDWILDKLKAF